MILNAQETVFLHTAIKHEVDSNPHKKAQFDKIVKKIEEAKPEEHATWQPADNNNLYAEVGKEVKFYRCSKCGRLIMTTKCMDGKNLNDYPYCHCGARMNGGAE